MSVSNLAIGMVAVGTFLMLATNAILPPRPPVQIHSLTYQDGFVTQDRTIRSREDVFFAAWQAQVIAQDGTILCEGADSHDYLVGRKSALMTLQVWVGDYSCEVPEGTVFRLQSSYHWGDQWRTAQSDWFVK